MTGLPRNFPQFYYPPPQYTDALKLELNLFRFLDIWINGPFHFYPVEYIIENKGGENQFSGNLFTALINDSDFVYKHFEIFGPKIV